MVAVDRTPNTLDELPEGIRREVGDTTDQAMAKTLIDRIAGEAGPPEVLVNTIGGFLLDEAVNATPENLRVMMGVNLDVGARLEALDGDRDGLLRDVGLPHALPAELSSSSRTHVTALAI